MIVINVRVGWVARMIRSDFGHAHPLCFWKPIFPTKLALADRVAIVGRRGALGVAPCKATPEPPGVTLTDAVAPTPIAGLHQLIRPPGLSGQRETECARIAPGIGLVVLARLSAGRVEHQLAFVNLENKRKKLADQRR